MPKPFLYSEASRKLLFIFSSLSYSKFDIINNFVKHTKLIWGVVLKRCIYLKGRVAEGKEERDLSPDGSLPKCAYQPDLVRPSRARNSIHVSHMDGQGPKYLGHLLLPP